MDNTDRPAATVYFDGACPLCRAEISHYRAQTGADSLQFVDVAEPGTDLGSGLEREQALARFHVRGSDGALVSGAAAFVAVWSHLPRWQWAARVARLPGILPGLELAYRAFLPIRPYLSRVVGRVLATAPARSPAAAQGNAATAALDQVEVGKRPDR
jgi:predicted DCC family thiol-disulfide oxidoreductase YuxK